jgi:FAD/FMN-containing dehydrogenase
MLRAKPVGSTMKVFGKLLDREQVGSRGTWGIVATLEFFEHPVSELSHKKYLL